MNKIYVCSFDSGDCEVIECYVATHALALQWLHTKRAEYLELTKRYGLQGLLGEVRQAFPKEHPEHYHVMYGPQALQSNPGSFGHFEMFTIRPQEVLTSLSKEIPNV